MFFRGKTVENLTELKDLRPVVDVYGISSVVRKILFTTVRQRSLVSRRLEVSYNRGTNQKTQEVEIHPNPKGKCLNYIFRPTKNRKEDQMGSMRSDSWGARGTGGEKSDTRRNPNIKSTIPIITLR